MDSVRDLLAARLAKTIGGLHFQVAERALCLWNRYVSLERRLLRGHGVLAAYQNYQEPSRSAVSPVTVPTFLEWPHDVTCCLHVASPL